MLRLEYRSDDAAIGRDFYEKCLRLSVRFDRAVGFFASSVFSVCPAAFHSFFERGGKMRMICCPILESIDIDSIVRGYRDRPALLRHSELSVLSGERREVMRDRARLTSWLVANGNLDVRIAIRESRGRNHIYHEKLGFFGDSEGHWIAFSGSANESFSALEGNFESVDVFRSWVAEERRRLDQKRQAFDRLWDNETEGVEVVPFFEAARRGELKARVPFGTDAPSDSATESSDASPPFTNVGTVAGFEEILLIPGDISLRDHQKRALRAWFDAKGRGILEMATGSGKTITALAIASKFYEWANAPTFIVIVCPFLHLCAQWIEEARRFGLDPLLCALDRRTWMEPLSTRLFNLTSGTRRIASVVVSNATFASPAFQSLLTRSPPHSLLIVDEVHNVGAADLRQALPPGIQCRLGLSATPSAAAGEPAERTPSRDLLKPEILYLPSATKFGRPAPPFSTALNKSSFDQAEDIAGELLPPTSIGHLSKCNRKGHSSAP